MLQVSAVARLFLFATLFAIPATATRASEWQPMAVGHRWAFKITESQEIRLAGQVVGREQKRGRFVRDVVRQGRRADVPVPVFVFEDVRSWQGAPTQRFTTLAAQRGGAVLEIGVDTGDGLIVHDQPLIQVPASIQGGLQWDVGSFALDGLTIEMQGEVLGLQNARTPAQTFERCLKVRYTGQLRGLVEVPEGRLPVRSGTLDVTQWFAPDVGVVLSEESVELEVLTAQGVMTIRTTDHYALDLFETRPTLPASP